MENKNYDFLNGIELTNNERKEFETNRIVSSLVISLIEKRMELKMSQRDLSKKTGIPQSMIARIETFESTPRLDTIVRLCLALNLNLQTSNVVGVPYSYQTVKSENLTYKMEEEKNNSFSLNIIEQIVNLMEAK